MRYYKDLITAVVTTSPIPSNPSTELMEITYHSIRNHLDDIPIFILADGIRLEQEHFRSSYTEFKNSLKQNLPYYWPDTKLFEFPEFMHQAGMIRNILNRRLIQTPLVLWVEHDLPLQNKYIDWNGITQTLLSKEVSSIRFAIDDGRKPNCERGEFISQFGVPLIRTVQYSSLPHIARLDLFEFICSKYKYGQIHLECDEICAIMELDDHNEYKLTTYNPPEDVQRCYSLGGRGHGETGFIPEKLPMYF